MARNVFYHGAGGCGKSTLITADAESTKAAMTGAAAYLIGGRTLHSILGIGLAKESAETLARLATGKPTVVTAVRALKKLAVDEVSMLSAELYDKIDEYLKIVRRDGRPWGGIQLVFSGDLFQLPPVEGRLLIYSERFAAAGFEVRNLTVNYRHASSPAWTAVLAQLRLGYVAPWVDELLHAIQARGELPAGPVAPTRLKTKNKDVNAYNTERLLELGNPVSVWEPVFSGGSASERAKFEATLRSELEATVCVGAQVMVTANIDQAAGIVNGTRGVVTAVDARLRTVTLRLVDGRVAIIAPSRRTLTTVRRRTPMGEVVTPEITVTFVPLRLAWAMSIHRCQGATLDLVDVDLTGCWSPGQAYTALSRVRDLGGMQLRGWTGRIVPQDPALLDGTWADMPSGWLSRLPAILVRSELVALAIRAAAPKKKRRAAETKTKA